MGLPNEQIKARKENPNVKFLCKNICKKNGDKDFVFISYKSDDWEIVLKEIVYRLVKEYGLNIYFDGDFEDNNPHWTTQFPENMESDKCKGVLVFLDDKYATSYATLMELMHSQFGCQDAYYDFISKPVVSINLVKALSVIDDESDTGLGKSVYFDGEKEIKNIKAPDEQALFDDDFDRGCESNVIKKTKKPYLKNKELSKKLCSVMVEEVLKSIDYNDNFYDGNLDGIVNSIRSVCGETVFCGKREVTKHNVVVVNVENKKSIQVNEGDLVPAQDAGIRAGFEFEGWFVSNTDEEWDFSNPVHEDIEICAKWEAIKPDSNEGYRYTIFGEYYEAGSREQGKLMFDAFEALTTRYPEYAEQLTQRTSVAKAEDVKNANTKNADPTYFRGCKAYNIEGVEYLVGTSYGYKAKLTEIKGMFKICGVPLSEFVLDGQPLGSGHADPVPPVESTLWEYNTKGAYSKLMWNGETTGVSAVITVLKGSAVAAPSPNFEKSCKPAYTLKADLEANGIIQNGKFTQDYTYDKVATMINLLNGGSVSTPAEVKSGHLRELDDQTEDVIKGKEDIADDIEDVLDNDMNGGDSVTAATCGFEYTLWGISHASNKMSDMMHDVFDLIAEKYPGKISELAVSDAISSVARKDDVDGKNLPASKLNYFRASREHNVNGIAYYVGTSYNRSQGIGQIERMLKICEGSADSFVITSSPERISHSGGNTGKKGIGELL